MKQRRCLVGHRVMISFRDLMFQIFFRMMLLGTIVHEYGHLLSLRLMGYSGIIRSNALNMVTALDYSLMSLRERQFFFLSGGLFQGIIFLTMCLFDRDEEDRLANKMVAIQGLIYMFFEAFTHRQWWEMGATVGLIISAMWMVFALNEKSNPTQ